MMIKTTIKSVPLYGRKSRPMRRSETLRAWDFSAGETVRRRLETRKSGSKRSSFTEVTST